MSIKKITAICGIFLAFICAMVARTSSATDSIVGEDKIASFKSVNSITINGKNVAGGGHFVRYNILYIDLDQAFPLISEALGIQNTNSNYKQLFNEFSKRWHYSKIVGAGNAGIGQVYRPSSTPDKMEFNRAGGVITVSDIYNYKVSSAETVTLDDSTRVGIETEGDYYYVPLHFLGAIPGITYSIDNGMLMIDVRKVSDYNSLSDKRTYRSDKVYKNYVGGDDNALWRNEALKRIEKYRKSSITINVKDASGAALSNSTIKMEMISNSFNFGTSTDNTSSFSTIWYDDAKHTASGDISPRYFNLIESGNLFTNTLSTNFERGRNEFLTDAKNKGFTNIREHVFFWDRSVGFEPVVVYKDGDTANLTSSYVSFKSSNSSLSSDALGQKLVKMLDDTNVLEYKNNTFLNALTMHAVYDMKKAGKLSQDDIDKVLLPALKRKLENTIIEYIKRSVNYSGISEWEIFNEFGRHEYFKYYLYDAKFLDDNEKFFIVENGKVKYPTTMNAETEHPEKAIAYSEDYIKFLEKCIKTFREVYNNNGKSGVKLIVNDTSLDGRAVNRNGTLGFIDAVERELSLINTLRNRGNTIDAFGVQYHVNGRLYNTPMSYYNNIQKAANRLGGVMAKVEEYDNVPADASYDSPSSSYISDTLKARYLRDTIIASYSNIKSDEFIMWVYNDKRNFTNAEREMYKSLVEPWIHDVISMSNNTRAGMHKYKTRPHKGSYKLTVTAEGCNTYVDTISTTGTRTFDVTLTCYRPSTGEPPLPVATATEDGNDDLPEESENKIDKVISTSATSDDRAEVVVTINNTSDTTMKSVTITDNIPEGAELVSGSVKRIKYTDGMISDIMELDDSLTYEIGDLESGEFIQIVYEIETNGMSDEEITSEPTMTFEKDGETVVGDRVRVKVEQKETCDTDPEQDECRERSNAGMIIVILAAVDIVLAVGDLACYLLIKHAQKKTKRN